MALGICWAVTSTSIQAVQPFSLPVPPFRPVGSPSPAEVSPLLAQSPSRGLTTKRAAPSTVREISPSQLQATLGVVASSPAPHSRWPTGPPSISPVAINTLAWQHSKSTTVAPLLGVRAASFPTTPTPTHFRRGRRSPMAPSTMPDSLISRLISAWIALVVAT